MSIDLNWEAATSGPDGEQLAERIRSFIHDKFQQVPLPRFIRSVNVHSFAFGSIAPELEIKDICDPFPDFYEESDSEEENDDQQDSASADAFSDRVGTVLSTNENSSRVTIDKNGREAHENYNPAHKDDLRTSQWVRGSSMNSDYGHSAPLRPPVGLGDHLSAQFRSGTPSILPGVTSNLGYHLMIGNLSGTQTPLAAVASGGSPFGTGWPDAMLRGINNQPSSSNALEKDREDVSRRTEFYNAGRHETGSLSRPSTANTNPTQLSHGHSVAGTSSNNTSNDPTVIYNDQVSSTATTRTTAAAHGMRGNHDEETPPSPTPHMRERRPEDFQVICRMKYAGDVKLSLTADILLDYPMPSFVGLPLKLNITGITFDGLAVVAYTRRRTHLCFLSPEDADALLGDEQDDEAHRRHQQQQQQQQSDRHHHVHPMTDAAGTTSPGMANHTGGGNDFEKSHLPHSRRRFGSLLQQIRVDSEIGRKEDGKQALKNVGKVERFVLDQVRRIFEDEFVYPSFWTFLV